MPRSATAQRPLRPVRLPRDPTTRRVGLIGAQGSLDDLLATSFFSDLPSDSFPIHVQESAQEHTLTPGESIRKKKFKLYTATTIVEMKDQDSKEKSRAFFTRKLNQILVKRSLSILNHHRLKLKEDIDAKQLEEVLLDEVDAICAENDIPLTDPYSVAMGNTDSKGVSDPERSIRLAAEYALEIWNPEVYQAIQRRARYAGRKGRKVSLEDHLATAHMTATAAAKALGVHRNTIMSSRKYFADVDVQTGEVSEGPTSTTETDCVRDRTGAEVKFPSAVELASHDSESGTRPNCRSDRPSEDRETWLATVVFPY